MEKKKLLIYAHYYIPDTASTGQILRELAEGMLDKFDITVICVVPSYLGTIEDKYKTQKYYEENINGVKVLRVRVPEFSKTNKKSRIKNIVSYFFGAMTATLKVGKMDYVFSISQPPILGGLLGVWGKWVKHAKYIYNIQDFNPEQVLAVGYSKSKLITDVMMGFDKFSCKRSNLIVTVGRDLVETVEKRFSGKKVPKTVMINNWIDEKEIYSVEVNHSRVVAFKEKYGLQNKFVIMYSGNIGLYYDLENLMKVIEGVNPGTKTTDGREVAFAFVGAGSVLDKLVAYKNENHMDNVVFIPYQEKAELIYSLNAADVHWCVNAKGIKGVSCPSKAYGIMAAGKPCIGVLEEGTEIRTLIEESRCGLCCAPEDYTAVEGILKKYITEYSAAELNEMGARGRMHLEMNLTKDISIKNIEKASCKCKSTSKGEIYMSVLLISQRKLYPMADGALIYSFGLIKLLKKMGGDVTLVSFTDGEEYTKDEIEELKKYVSEVHLCKLTWKSTALNLSIKYPNNIRKYTRKAMYQLLEDIRKRYDTVIIDHLQMYEYAKMFSDCRVILHTHNVESDIWFEYAEKCKGIVKALVKRSAKMVYEYEKKAIETAGYVTAISESDAQKFMAMAPGKKVEVLRGFSEYQIIKDENSIYRVGKKILFIGSYGWYPNVASAKYLINDVMPILRERNLDVKLYLVGKDPTDEMIEYGKKYTDIIVTGMVDSVDPYIEDCDLFVNAVCGGSGINIKMTEAMGKGIPIITSEFGARGYNLENGQEVLIYKDATECVNFIEKLLLDREFALEMRNKARAFYEEFNMPSEKVRDLFLGK